VGRRPDVLIVVLDTVRWDAVFTGDRVRATLPNLSELARAGVSYPRAIAPANWTLPSHYSLLSGLYPWEHGVTELGSVPRVCHRPFSRDARSEGYATASFSANPYLSDDTGLTAGFQTALWGQFLECSARGVPAIARPRGRGPNGRGDRSPVETDPRPTYAPPLSALERLCRPWFAWPDVISHAIRCVQHPNVAGEPRVSPWIEGAFDSWLGSVPSSTPALGLVNFMDAHEPYLGLAPHNAPWGQRTTLWAANRLASMAYARGDGALPPKAATFLRNLYDLAVRGLDLRLGRLLSLWGQHRDIDGSLVIVVSDHGQAFGEGGEVYHGFGTEEAQLRVPLIMRYPHGDRAGSIVPDWYSTRRIAGHVREVIQRDVSPEAETVTDRRAVQPTVVWGLGSRRGSSAALPSQGSTSGSPRPLQVVGFVDGGRVIFDPAGATAFRPECPASFARADRGTDAVLTLDERARLEGIRIVAGLRPSVRRSTPTVSTRLASWGYT